VDNLAVLDLPAPTAHACGYRPPRLGDLLHVSLDDGDVHSAMVQSVSDDGDSLIVRGPAEPLRRKDLIMVIRRVGGTTTEE